MVHQLVISGENVGLCLDYARLVALEERLQCGVMGIAARLAEGMLPLSDVVKMIAVCADAKLQVSGLGEKLVCVGISRVAEVLAAMLCEVLAGQGESATQSAERAELKELMRQFPDD